MTGGTDVADAATERAEVDFGEEMTRTLKSVERDQVTIFEPLGDRVLVRPMHEPETETPGGLYIPPSAQEEKQIGEVLAVGPGRVTDQGVRIEPQVSVGDAVMYGRYAGAEIELGGEEYLVLQEGDLMGIVR